MLTNHRYGKGFSIMRYNNVLLLILTSFGERHIDNLKKSTLFGTNPHAEHPMAGPGYIAEVLLKSNIDYRIFDSRLGYSLEDLKKNVLQYKPDLVGVTMLTPMYKWNYKILESIKEWLPEVTIILGGPHITAVKEKALEECMAIDIGVLNEGEETILELCQGKNVREIKGILFRYNDDIVYTGRRSVIENLDKVPFPTYKGFELDKYLFKEISLVTSRGCPFNCIFCTISTTMGKKVRTRTPKFVVDEIEYWVNRGYRQFLISDDNFTFYRDRVLAICDEIEKRDLGYLEFRCGNGIRADRVDKDLLTRMREVGFRWVAFGIEAGNNKILKNVKKGETIEVIKKAIREADEAGLMVEGSILIGSPGETWEDIEDSLRLCEELPLWRVKFFQAMPYPDTELYNWVSENNYFLCQPQDYLNNPHPRYKTPVFETPELSREERIKVNYLADKVNSRLYKKATMKRLARYGILSNIIGSIYLTNIVQKLIIHNRYIRRAIDRMRMILQKQDDKELSKR